MVKVEENTNIIVRILKGSAISLLITLVLLTIFATLLTYTNINENTMPTVIIVVTSLSILIGSQITTTKIKKNGIVNGAIVGGIYIVILYFISSIIAKNFSFNNYSIIMIIASLVTGGLGGIIGVNRK